MTKERREELGYWFAGISMALGFAITIAGFIVPPLGIVHDSILWILGQCLLFTGAIIGVDLHVKDSVGRAMDDVRRQVEERKHNNIEE